MSRDELQEVGSSLSTSFCPFKGQEGGGRLSRKLNLAPSVNLYLVLVLIVTLWWRHHPRIYRGDGGGAAISPGHPVSDRPVLRRRDLMDLGAFREAGSG